MLGAILLGYLADIMDIAILIYCVGICNHSLMRQDVYGSH